MRQGGEFALRQPFRHNIVRVLNRPERYKVDFPVFIAWQDRQGIARRVMARCVDLSAAGANVEAKDQLASHSMVLISSDVFGRMGNASVRYCKRSGMKYNIGLHFTAPFQLSDPVRKEILQKVLRRAGEPGSSLP